MGQGETCCQPKGLDVGLSQSPSQNAWPTPYFCPWLSAWERSRPDPLPNTTRNERVEPSCVLCQLALSAIREGKAIQTS